jgi:hypothetical protein
MSLRIRVIGVLMVLAAIALLYPGVTQPVLTLQGELEKSALAEFGIDLLAGEDETGQTRAMLDMFARMLGLDELEGRILAYENTRSIWGVSRELADTGNVLVAAMIVTFSVVIPSLKLLLQLLAFAGPGKLGYTLLRVNAALSKWSMADVFVMAMLIAFLAGRASNHMGELLIMDARLEIGFWYFSGYCLFAVASGSLLAWLAGRDGAATQPQLSRNETV